MTCQPHANEPNADEKLMPCLYVKRPIPTPAIQWFKDGDHPAVVRSVKRPDGTVFCHDNICEDGGAGYVRTFAIPTLEGAHEVRPGDWILTGIKGECWPVKPDIFAATYEPFNTRATPPAAPAVKFRRGDRIRKIKGSEWQGLVVGEYSTALTPEGYAVESEAHKGSVQIYPASALEKASEV